LYQEMKLQFELHVSIEPAAASFPGTIQRGFYNREPAHESRSGKIATNSTKNCSTYILTKLEKSVPIKSVEDNVLC